MNEILGKYRNNYKLAHLTRFKVGGVAEVFFKPLNINDLVNFLVKNNKQASITVIGACSNTLIRDGGIEGVVIQLTQGFNDIKISQDGHLVVGAGCLNSNLVKFCTQNSICGFEFLVGIPGTVGGGVIMNAGAYEKEFCDLVIAIEVVDFNGIIKIIDKDKIKFKYRNSNLSKDLIITKVFFKVSYSSQSKIINLINIINERRYKTQPVKELTCGSTFMNPKGYAVWRLIESVGLRGYKIGGAYISTLHCNFMINDGYATAKDLEDLGGFIQSKVYEYNGIMLEWEIKIIGKDK